MSEYIITAGKYVMSNRTSTREWWWGHIDMYMMKMTYPVAKEMLAAMRASAATYGFPDDAVEWYASIEPTTFTQNPVGHEIHVRADNFNKDNYAKIGDHVAL